MSKLSDSLAREVSLQEWYGETKTLIRQAPLLGRGGGKGRQHGGLWKFATRYVQAEKGSPEEAYHRCSFERYGDFTFYTDGNWHDGKKMPLVIVEAESNSTEILGELAGLLVMRCPVKYLFISEAASQIEKISRYCSSCDGLVNDWVGTTYFLLEIPVAPALPSKWPTYRAVIASDSETLSFRRLNLAD